MTGNLFRLNKYSIGIFTILLWVGCQSCFQFRSSDTKQLKKLSVIPSGFRVEIGHKEGGDRAIHYTLITSDTIKPLAVFVHGSPGSSDNFLHFAKDTQLLAKYDLVFVDRPGFGYSDFGNAEPSMQEQSLMLREVIKQLHYESIFLVGHSLGGPIICRMAMDEPTLASGLVIVAGSVSPELEPNEKWRKPMSSKWLRWIMPKSFRVSNDEIIPAAYHLMQMDSLWTKIRCPVQVLQGGKDKLVPPGNADYARNMLVNAEYVKVYKLPELNHFIPFSEPQLVTEALLRF